MISKKKNTVVIISIIGFVVIIVLLVILLSKKKTSTNDTYPDNENDIDQSKFPLKNGSQGTYVSMLQQWLLDNGASLPNYGVDGIFGSETENALAVVTGQTSMSYVYFLENVM